MVNSEDNKNKNVKRNVLRHDFLFGNSSYCFINNFIWVMNHNDLISDL